MTRNIDMTRRTAAALAVCAALALAPVPARCEETGRGGAPALAGVGMAFENARLLPHEARAKALEEAAASIALLLEGGLPKERQIAALLLSAEIQFALGRYEAAADLYKRAGEKDREKIYRDDAEAGRILALEAAGRDGEAAKEWKKWRERHPDSPLMSEASLACAWNALRRGDRAEAASALEEISSRWPWMDQDRRVVLARSAIGYIAGDYAGTLELLGSLEDSPAAVYLRGLCP
ncbi:MAG: hypothetical protein PHQ19_10560, partial [Candidatus Krumholzibacteria bacterium]|nr:hypothetical protein [Candidatus Krumholzibacteria bacterium]